MSDWWFLEKKIQYLSVLRHFRQCCLATSPTRSRGTAASHFVDLPAPVDLHNVNRRITITIIIIIIQSWNRVTSHRVIVHRVNDINRVGSGLGSNIFMSTPAGWPGYRQNKKNWFLPRAVVSMPRTHDRIMLAPSEHALASQLVKPPYQLMWHPLLPSSNDPFPATNMVGNDLQMPDTDFYDRSCCNLRRHEARVVNQTRLHFTIDMHSLYL